MENNNPLNKLTDEQVESILEAADKNLEGSDGLKKIVEFPSNQGVEESTEETREEGGFRKMMVGINPETGEHQILGEAVKEETVDTETFEEMCERLENSDFKFDRTPITEKEITEHIVNSKGSSILNEIADETDLSPETTKALLNIINRKNNREEFNVYKSFPPEIQKMVDEYIIKGGIPITTNEGKRMRNLVCESLINEFITDINTNRIMHDFNSELEEIFNKGSEELADTVVGYTMERNAQYREYANKLEDEEKKQSILAVLDQIDEAYNLTNLKEFAKRCKIKKIDLEKPKRIFQHFISKYENSPYNIYDIDFVRPILLRNINKNDTGEVFTATDIDAFFICFCKQCMNMSSDVVTEHAYMYYTIYNIAIIDINRGNSKNVSDQFLENVKEVIYNIRERNTYLKVEVS